MLTESLPWEDAALDAALAGNARPVEPLRAALSSAQANLQREFESGTPASDLVHRRSNYIDHLICKLWCHFFPAHDAAIALIAVGGYGRGELHPGSDIDLLILLREPNQAQYKESIERFLTLLWDIGLEVGHSVRTIEECGNEAAADITIATNLTEARLLFGSPELFDAMRAAIATDRIWNSRDFFAAKWQEQITRHHKFHDTAYNLEPNIKEGPGGLRDIQTIGWVAKRHFGATTLHDLVEHDFLTEEEYQALRAGQDFLWQIRFALHTLTGRREDRLLFDYQRTLAEKLGYRDGGPNLAVEQFMKRYYLTVMELSRLNEMLLQLFQEAILYAEDPGIPLQLNNRFRVRKGFIEVTHDKVIERYPFALLEIFLLLQQHHEIKGVRATTIRLIRNNRHLIDDKFRNDLRNRSLFMEILRQPYGLTGQLRRMNRYGVLGAYLPAFGQIIGLMQYDLFHVYTVDEHILMVVRNLRRFAVPKHNDEFPLCSEIMQKHVPKAEIAYLAALFHDIAKGRGGDHSELGTSEALAFCLHHGMSQYDAHLVAWLVKHHLVMSMTSQRKDISDPEVIMEFATMVRNPVFLNYLYLITVADIRGTNPALWNSWKDTLLLDLYTSTMRVLRRGLENPIDVAERISETRQQARELLLAREISSQDIDTIWNDLPEDYFLRYDAEEVVWHTQALLQHAADDMPLILLRRQTRRGGTEIFIHTRYDDRLFARITQILDQLALNILSARIIGARNQYTLDTYIILDEAGDPITSDHRVHDIITALQTQIGKLDEGDVTVSRRRPRQFKYFPIPTQVTYIQDERRGHTIMELMTADRPGLLSRVGKAMVECGVRLHNAKIATFGARVEDVLFVTDRQNHPLSADLQEHLRKTIIRYLDKPETSKASA